MLTATLMPFLKRIVLIRETPFVLVIQTTSTLSSTATSSATASTPQNKASSKNKKSKSIVSVIVSDSAVVPLKPTPEPDFKKFYVFRVSDQTTPRESNLIETLLDTGSLAGNFVLRQVVNDLHLQADIITKTCTSTVCSGLDNQCYDLTSTIPLKLSYFCSIINNYASFKIQAFIVDNSPLKLIIGLQSIRKLNLFNIFPEYVGLNKTTTKSSTVIPSNSNHHRYRLPCRL